MKLEKKMPEFTNKDIGFTPEEIQEMNEILINKKQELINDSELLKKDLKNKIDEINKEK